MAKISAKSGANRELYIGIENADGTLTDYIQYLRNTSDSVNGATESIASNELLKGRSTAAPRPGNASATGDVSIEFAPKSFDLLLAAAMMNNWTKDIIADPSGKTSVLVPGNIKKRFFVLKYFSEPDHPLYQLFKGVQINTLNLSFAINAIVTGSFGLMGINDPLVSTGKPDGIGDLPDLDFIEAFSTREGFLKYDADLPINYATQFDLAANNNLAALNALFEKEAYDIKEKKFDVTGTLTAYFTSEVLHNKRVNQEDTRLVLEVSDKPEGGADRTAYRFEFPAVKLTGSDTGAGGQDEITPAYPFTSFGTQPIKITRILPEAAPVITLIFEGNGNDGGTEPDSIELEAGSVAYAPGAGDLEKTGETFAGWNTEEDGTGTDYAIGAAVVISEDRTLYAKWV